MSRKEQPLPWRVIAIAVTLIVVVFLVVWSLLGPSSTPGIADAGGAPGATPGDETQTGAPGGDVDMTAPSVAGTTAAAAPDPTTPEGRAALTDARAAAGTMDVQLFLIVPGLERLVPVAYSVAAPATLEAQIRVAVEELIGWSSTDATSPLPADTVLRESWTSPGGIAYLDFTEAFLGGSAAGSLGELHAVYGVVATLTESFPEIVAVQFLIEGEQTETLAGHVDLTRPVLPSDEWVHQEGRRQPLSPFDGPR